jgi:hypothetical protein
MLFLITVSMQVYGQTGNLKGRVMDKDTKEPIPFANVALENGGTLIAGSTTDFDGKYEIRNISQGLYDLKVSFVGYKTAGVKGLIIKADQITFHDVELEISVETLETVMIVEYKIPLISRDKTTSGATVTAHSIGKVQGSRSNTVATTVGGLYADKQETGFIRGTRNCQTVLYINGVSVKDANDPPVPTTEPGTLIIGGEPAKGQKSSGKNITIEDIISPPKPLHHILTAGEINDFSKWDYWAGVAGDEFEQFREVWGIYPQNRYCVQVINEKGLPVIGCSAILMDGSGNAIWQAKTDNTGKAELWKGIFTDEDNRQKVKILLEKDGIYKTINKPLQIKNGINTITLETGCNYSNEVDVLFAVDATGSMGDEIDYLKAEMENIIGSLNEDMPDLELRLGSVFYRCFGNEYVTRKSDFSADINQTTGFINRQFDGEGGTEAVEEALRVAVEEMHWNDNARAKILFIILDEPPGNDPEIKAELKEQIAKAAQMGIRIVPVVASGMFEYNSDKTLEFLMRSIALATNGTFVFLTDDSGIGNAHAKPSIDDYEVELLNDLIIRLLKQYTYVEKYQDDNSKELALAESVEEVDSTQNITDVKNHQDENEKDEKFNSKEKIWVKAFPNPTTGKCTIEHDKKVNEIFVTDLTGKILLRVETDRKSATEMDLSPFPNGLYFLRFANVDHWEYVKVVVRH